MVLNKPAIHPPAHGLPAVLAVTILYTNTVFDFDPVSTRFADRRPVTAGRPAGVATALPL